MDSEVGGKQRWARQPRRRLLGFAAGVVVLGISNVLVNRVLPGWAYVPWNLGITAVLLLIARVAGVGPVAVGLGIRNWHRPVGVGLLLAAGTALIFAIGMLLPATRDAFIDSRVQTASAGMMLYQVLIRIPLGTVVLEEVAFRGVLPALLGQSPAIKWRWGPVLGASFLFGLWHILPSIGLATGNAAVSEAVGGNQLVTTALAVVSMTIAGVLMCALVRLGKGIKATMLLHWATNSLGYVAAWLLMY